MTIAEAIASLSDKQLGEARTRLGSKNPGLKIRPWLKNHADVLVKSSMQKFELGLYHPNEAGKIRELYRLELAKAVGVDRWLKKNGKAAVVQTPPPSTDKPPLTFTPMKGAAAEQKTTRDAVQENKGKPPLRVLIKGVRELANAGKRVNVNVERESATTMIITIESFDCALSASRVSVD